MSAALDRCTAALGDSNTRAFLHVIAAGESGEQLTDLDYRVINGGSHFDAPPWRHPYHGIPTTQGGRASGAFQFLGTTWKRVDEALELGGDFSPASQNVGAVYLMAGRGALSAVMRGDLETACHKLSEEWVSLPGMGMARIKAVFQAHGGTLAAQDGAGAAISPQPISTTQPDAPLAPRPPQKPEKPMLAALPLLQLFAPILSSMIPQIASLLKPGSEVAQRNVGIAQVVLDTITQATNQPNLQGAVEAMQANPELKKAVQQAIVSQPEIMGVLEIGGGIQAARAANLAVQNADKSFLYNPAFWVTLLLLPMAYWIVGSVLIGGIDTDENSWQIWKIFGRAFDAETRSGMVNLVIGMVLGGIVGIWFGTSYGSMRKTELAASATEQAVAKP